VSDSLACFYGRLRSDLPAELEDYVDWQKELGLDDVKESVLTQLTLSRANGDSTQVLITGQKGTGKSTELYRLRERLRDQHVFVAYENGEFLEQMGSDLTAGDLLYFAAERLVSDLHETGIVTNGVAWTGFWNSLKSKVGVELKGPFGFGIGVSLRDEPTKRSQLRQLLDAERSRFLRMVNVEVLGPAKQQLGEHGFAGITLLMDGLGDIPPRGIEDPLRSASTNHEQIFVEQGDLLRGLACDVVYTFPIELAYQGLTLGNQGGGEALELGIVRICNRDGSREERGRATLRRMVEQRAQHCGVALDELFQPDDIDLVIDVSGGHIRTVFELLQASINRAGLSATPVPSKHVDEAVRKRADMLQRVLRQSHREVLGEVQSNKAIASDSRRKGFTELLFSQHVLAYYDEHGTFYGAHPLAVRSL
jgi:hypothetical protein